MKLLSQLKYSLRLLALGALLTRAGMCQPLRAQPASAPSQTAKSRAVPGANLPQAGGAKVAVPKGGQAASDDFDEDEWDAKRIAKLPPFAVSMAKAKALKAKGDFKGAQKAIYDARDVNWRDPLPDYMLGWIDIAQHRQKMAIFHFRSALRSGLKGKDAAEAKAALHRMGATVAFPKYVPKKRTALQRMTSQMLMMDLLRPTPLDWAKRTFIILSVTAVAWALIALLIAFAAKERPGDFEIRYIAFWSLALFGLLAAGEFWLSYRVILPLILVYLAMAVGQFLAPLGYGFRRLTTKKVMDKGAIVSWGAFYTLLFLDITAGKTFMAPFAYGLTAAAGLLWLVLNPWVIVGQRAQRLKNKGDLAGAIKVMEGLLQKPRISQKTRFAMLNDISSFYMTMNRPTQSLETAKRALEHVAAFRTAEVLPHLNMAEAHMSLGHYQDSVDELAKVWHLTETGDCIMGNDTWKGKTHGLLAMLNYWRGWMDEAERQADLCLEAFPAEKRASQSIKNSVAYCRAIKGAVRLQSGDLETAQRYVAAAPKVGPKQAAEAFCLYVASLLAQAEGKRDEATSQAQKALKVSPNYFPAQILLAQLAAEAGAHQDAAPALAAALEKHKSHRMAPHARQLLVSWGHPVPETAEAIAMELFPEPLAPPQVTI